MVPVVVGLRFAFHAVEHLVADNVGKGVAVLVVGVVFGAVLIFVELHPEVGQLVRRVVEIGDGLRAGEQQFVLIQVAGDIVVAALLPVFWAGCAAGGAIFVRRREDGSQRFELVAVVGCRVILNILGRQEQNRTATND